MAKHDDRDSKHNGSEMMEMVDQEQDIQWQGFKQYFCLVIEIKWNQSHLNWKNLWSDLRLYGDNSQSSVESKSLIHQSSSNQFVYQFFTWLFLFGFDGFKNIKQFVLYSFPCKNTTWNDWESWWVCNSGL